MLLRTKQFHRWSLAAWQEALCRVAWCGGMAPAQRLAGFACRHLLLRMCVHVCGYMVIDWGLLQDAGLGRFAALPGSTTPPAVFTAAVEPSTHIFAGAGCAGIL